MKRITTVIVLALMLYAAPSNAMTDAQLLDWCRDVMDDVYWTTSHSIQIRTGLPWYVVDTRLRAAWVKGWLYYWEGYWWLRVADHPGTDGSDPGDDEPGGGW